MKKFSTLDQNILQISDSPENLRLFIDGQIEKVRLLEMGPDDLTVKKIISYSKALSVHKTEKTGAVNVILN